MKHILMLAIASATLTTSVSAKDNNTEHNVAVSDKTIAAQRAELAENTAGKGFGPQSPRDINSLVGNNKIIFSQAPAYTQMNLCNIHFHKNAEHSGGEFTTYAGNGDGKGYSTGFKYSGSISKKDLLPVKQAICPSEHGNLIPGDTIELHYVHSTAQVSPGPTLGACLSESVNNPQLRVETQVFVLVNNAKALDFGQLTQLGQSNGYHQALNIPSNTGNAIQYAGSTTGPGYNEQGSPLQVSWSVRPKVAQVNIATVGKWCESNVFNEDHAHGVRNLVTNLELLSAGQ
ncbi:delta-class carbonic anhydrase [Shewanella sp. HL-SH2]|uniref:delta-class carbonic anhydrase n=1 Tax=Shewanella sp. HL-SH2 TaxID=3436238 RepID=UPI003EBEFF15